MRLRSRCWVFGLDQSVGKSVARARIRFFSSSVRVAVAAVSDKFFGFGVPLVDHISVLGCQLRRVALCHT